MLELETNVALRLRGVSKSYRAGLGGCGAAARVLASVDLDVAAGEIVALSGARGAGKSTLLRCAAGLLRPDAGSVSWLDRGRRPGSGEAAVVYVTASVASSAHTVSHPPGVDDPLMRLRWRPEAPRILLVDDFVVPPTRLVWRTLEAWLRTQAAGGAAVVVATPDASSLAGVASRHVHLAHGRIWPRGDAPAVVAERRASDGV